MSAGVASAAARMSAQVGSAGDTKISGYSTGDGVRIENAQVSSAGGRMEWFGYSSGGQGIAVIVKVD